MLQYRNNGDFNSSRITHAERDGGGGAVRTTGGIAELDSTTMFCEDYSCCEGRGATLGALRGPVLAERGHSFSCGGKRGVEGLERVNTGCERQARVRERRQGGDEDAEDLPVWVEEVRHRDIVSCGGRRLMCR